MSFTSFGTRQNPTNHRINVLYDKRFIKRVTILANIENICKELNAQDVNKDIMKILINKRRWFHKIIANKRFAKIISVSTMKECLKNLTLNTGNSDCVCCV